MNFETLFWVERLVTFWAVFQLQIFVCNSLYHSHSKMIDGTRSWCDGPAIRKIFNFINLNNLNNKYIKAFAYFKNYKNYINGIKLISFDRRSSLALRRGSSSTGKTPPPIPRRQSELCMGTPKKSSLTPPLPPPRGIILNRNMRAKSLDLLKDSTNQSDFRLDICDT